VLEWQVFDPLPTPKDDDVLIAILATGISGTDNLQRVGGHPDPRVASPGFTPGHDFVGEVVALGPAVPADSHHGRRRHLAVGDRVAAMCMCGAYATHILLPAAAVLPLRDTDDPVRFAALPLNYMTAYGLLTQSAAAGALAPGKSVLIGSAAGGIGTAVAQLVRAFDLRLTLFGTCSPAKFAHVRALGVIPIDRHAGGGVAAEVRALTGGAGVDVAFDAVGSEESLRASAAATKDGTGVLVGVGAMASIAADGSGLRPGFDTLRFLRNGGLPRSSFFAMSLSYYAGARDVWLQDFEKVAQAVRDGKLDPVIGKLLPLSEAVRANEMLVTGEGVTGKLEFVVDAELAKAKGVI
jgi:NADPH:quinone reductase-like Zn-dependent oxidoreductase